MGLPLSSLSSAMRTYDKYIGWLDKGNRFDRFFIFMMIWPISPADFSLYAGCPDQDEFQALYDHHHSDQALYSRGFIPYGLDLYY